MKINWTLISTGLAFFSMFFGSGNLVFPILVGQESGASALFASIGIVLTGVLMPFLGTFGMMLYDGNITQFFRFFGKRGTLLLSFILLGLMGPFGVLARCFTVMHGALELLFGALPLAETCFFLCVCTFLLSLRKARILSTIGNWLTPLLVFLLALIAYFGFTGINSLPEVTKSPQEAFSIGFFQGYQLMDLLASFFFSSFVIARLKEQGNSLRTFFASSCIGMGLLSLVYVALVFLGALFEKECAGALPHELLGVITKATLGKYAVLCVGVTMLLACLTTAMALATLFSEFLQKDLCREKMPSSIALLITLSIGFFVSTFEFSGIARFLGPIVEMLYPVLILLTVINIGLKLYKPSAVTPYDTFR
jgi:LIVCS family branched-chain amino acid:cation transporter